MSGPADFTNFDFQHIFEGDQLNQQITGMIDLVIDQGGFVGHLLSAQRLYAENLKTATSLFVFQQKINIRAEFEAETERLRKDNGILRSAIVLLKQEAYDLCKTNVAHEITLEECRETIARLQYDLAETRKRKSGGSVEKSICASKKLEAIDEDMAILLGKLGVLHSMLEKKRQQTDGMSGEVRDLKTSRDALSSISSVQKICISELTKENIALKMKVKEMAGNNHSSPTKSTTPSDQASGNGYRNVLEEKVADLESRVNSLQNEKSEMQNTLDALKRHVDFISYESSRKDAEIFLLKSEVGRLSREDGEIIDLPNSSNSSECD